MIKKIVFIILFGTLVLAGERNVTQIGNIIIDIDYDLTKNNRALWIKRACEMAFKNFKNIENINYCREIVALDMQTRGGLSKQYLSKNTNVRFQVTYRPEDFHPLDWVVWTKLH